MGFVAQTINTLIMLVKINMYVTTWDTWTGGTIILKWIFEEQFLKPKNEMN